MQGRVGGIQGWDREGQRVEGKYRTLEGRVKVAEECRGG